MTKTPSKESPFLKQIKPSFFQHPILAVLIMLLLINNHFAWSEEALSNTDEKIKYQDIYLTEGRICKKCVVITGGYTGASVNSVVLENKKGERSTVRRDEILGIDNHPLWRKWVTHWVRSQDLAGEIIAPTAYQSPIEPLSKREQRVKEKNYGVRY